MIFVFRFMCILDRIGKNFIFILEEEEMDEEKNKKN